MRSAAGTVALSRQNAVGARPYALVPLARDPSPHTLVLQPAAARFPDLALSRSDARAALAVCLRSSRPARHLSRRFPPSLIITLYIVPVPCITSLLGYPTNLAVRALVPAGELPFQRYPGPGPSREWVSVWTLATPTIYDAIRPPSSIFGRPLLSRHPSLFVWHPRIQTSSCAFPVFLPVASRYLRYVF